MPAPAKSARQIAPAAALSEQLLAWYDHHARVLPWRISPQDRARGVLPDPYRIWLSEIMLQQTTVEAVKAYYLRFVERWPDVAALAAAEPDDIMKAWAGLGYYSRARNLKRCADIVAAEHDGQFPNSYEGLIALPGIGRYTASAIAAIAFSQPEAVVDGNVERVISRLLAIATPLPQAKRAIHDTVATLVPTDRPGDFAQAMMDLGATICTPRRPACILCPLNGDCQGLTSGDPALFPVRAAKAEKPLRRGAAFVAVRADGAVLLQKRPDIGLLGGMAEVPGTGWTARIDGATEAKAAPFTADWQEAGAIRHVFTHFELKLTVFRAETQSTAMAGYWWSKPQELSGEALPTVMKKAIQAALPQAFLIDKPGIKRRK